MGSSGRLILSAHLDDAVLSCWHALNTALPTTVATVFAGIPGPGVRAGSWDLACGVDDPRALVSARRAEDEAVVASCGASTVHLEFLEDQYRDGPVPRQAIHDAILELVCAHQEVWIPAAIGGHPDHGLAAAAALAASVGHCQRYLYADLPYAAQPSALLEALVMAGEAVEAHATVLASSPVLPADVLAHRRELGAQELGAKLDAVRGYRSQLPGLTAAFGPTVLEGSLLAQEFTWDLGPSEVPIPPIDALAVPDPNATPTAQRLVGPAHAPFLSVLLRTQGRRIQALRETLSSLEAQKCQDFEVLLLCHDTTASEQREIASVVAKLASTTRSRVRIESVGGGTRSRPLNVGLTSVRGQYFTVLDDDDVALPDWVSAFQGLAARRPGRVLRTSVATAQLDAEGWRVTATFPAEFDYVDHLLGNRSPVCGLAFPRRCIDEFHLEFSEQLSVLEDWDFMLRATQLFGVATASASTALYRRWESGDDSRAVHGAATFHVAERAVFDRVNSAPLLLPPGAAADLRQERRDRVDLESARDALEHRLHELDARASAELAAVRAEYDKELASLRAELEATREHAERAISDYRTSRSWRLTAPLRAAGTARLRLRGARSSGLQGPADQPPVHSSVEPSTWPASYFEELYARDPDPWAYATRWYERRKYALTLALLPQERYGRAFEPGCSIGVLTAQLARRCDELVAVDCVDAAVTAARSRIGHLAHVRVERLTVPREWPEGEFDLVVLSELAAYFDDEDLTEFLDKTLGSLRPGGSLVAVHYRPWGGTPQTADAVHHRLRARPGLEPMATHQEASFLADVLVRSA